MLKLFQRRNSTLYQGFGTLKIRGRILFHFDVWINVSFILIRSSGSTICHISFFQIPINIEKPVNSYSELSTSRINHSATPSKAKKHWRNHIRRTNLAEVQDVSLPLITSASSLAIANALKIELENSHFPSMNLVTFDGNPVKWSELLSILKEEFNTKFCLLAIRQWILN